MTARKNWTNSAKAALLLLVGASALCCTFAQQPVTGSLAGKLTDAHSSPLENVTVTLRNAASGAEMQTKTAHEGRYHFTALVQGESTLTATGPRGTGEVDGIYIASGHEAQVQTAINLHPQVQDSLASPAIRATQAWVTVSPAVQ